jgi:YHS domain-containing protein
MNSLKKIFVILLSSLLSLSLGGEIALGGPQVESLAIKGYDTVAYFKEGKAIKGSGSYSCQWHNLTWYFSNKKNMDQFKDDPGKYAPQYDGYCAWAMAEGRKPKRTQLYGKSLMENYI